ncbi:MAG: hypothetical protein WCG98_02545 [bacterium]
MSKASRAHTVTGTDAQIITNCGEDAVLIAIRATGPGRTVTDLLFWIHISDGEYPLPAEGAEPIQKRAVMVIVPATSVDKKVNVLGSPLRLKLISCLQSVLVYPCSQIQASPVADRVT